MGSSPKASSPGNLSKGSHPGAEPPRDLPAHTGPRRTLEAPPDVWDLQERPARRHSTRDTEPLEVASSWTEARQSEDL